MKPNTDVLGKITSQQGSPIRVTVPASLAFHPEAFQESIVNLMERLGCPQCFSGWDCSFSLQRDFLLRADKGVEAIERTSRSGVPTVNVNLEKELSFDLKRIKDLLLNLSQKHGCLPCHSGFDFRFRNGWRELSAANFVKV
jgi:hypothetical protein